MISYLLLWFGILSAATVPKPAADTRPYIVVMSDAAASIRGYSAEVAAANTAHRVTNMFAAQGAVVKHVCNSSIYGFSATLTPDALQHLQDDPDVYEIEQDGVVRTSNPPIWNLDRINQRRLPLDGVKSSSAEAGDGAVVYVVDTGVRRNHIEFSLPSGVSRVTDGKSFVQDGKGWEDCNGHGTHCASTAAGKNYGVAPGANIVSVRVLGCSGTGSYSDMIAGIDWIVRDSQRRAPGKSVISMSLGGGRSTAMNRAVDSAVDAGIAVVVAAGNENDDACAYSPSSSRNALTVASSDSRDRKSGFSNYGECVDIVAPGSDIAAADYRSRTGVKRLSGTSMACPHVAGAVAAETSRTGSSNAAARYVLQQATPSVINGLKAPMLYLPPPPATPIVPLPTPSPPFRPPLPPTRGACHTTSNNICVFPFVFRGQTYDSCTTTSDTKTWCSTKVDSRGQHVTGNWGYCKAEKECFACPASSRGAVGTKGTVATSCANDNKHGGCGNNSRSTIALSTLILVCVQTVACFAVVFFEIHSFRSSMPPTTPRITSGSV